MKVIEMHNFVTKGKNSTFVPTNIQIECLDILNKLNLNLPRSEGVYLIEFTNGGYYVGKSVNIARRIWCHLIEVYDRKSTNLLYDRIKDEDMNIKVTVLSNNKDEEISFIHKLNNERLDYCYNIQNKLKL